MSVEPVPGVPAAVADLDGERALVIADYHAGIEQGLRREGVELDSRGRRRRRRLRGLLAETDPDRLVVLGDLVHDIGDPGSATRTELSALFEGLSVPTTLVKGNHDGRVAPVLADLGVTGVTVTDPGGIRLGPVGFTHGHTWPDPEVLAGEVVCVGHEHPVVRLTDAVGGSRHERVWLRGHLDPDPFDREGLAVPGRAGTGLVVFPAFNERSGGSWVNVEERDFLSPFLPGGLDGGEAYLLDGTRLGPYRTV